MGAVQKKATGRTTPRGTHPATGKTTASFDRLKAKSGLVRRVPIHLESEAVDRFAAAEEAMASLENDLIRKRTPEPKIEATVQELAAAKAALEDSTMVLVFRRPVIHVTSDEPTEDEARFFVESAGDGTTHEIKGRRAYEWLVRHHPPTEEDNSESQKDHGVDAPYNGDLFAPALIAATCFEPRMKVEQVAELIDEWSQTEVLTMFAAAMEVATGSQIVSLGKGSGTTNGS